MVPTTFDAAPKPGPPQLWNKVTAAPRSLTLDVVAIDPGLEVIRTFSFPAVSGASTVEEVKVRLSCGSPHRLPTSPLAPRRHRFGSRPLQARPVSRPRSMK